MQRSQLLEQRLSKMTVEILACKIQIKKRIFLSDQMNREKNIDIVVHCFYCGNDKGCKREVSAEVLMMLFMAQDRVLSHQQDT
jgi:hypothetical protein